MYNHQEYSKNDILRIISTNFSKDSILYGSNVRHSNAYDYKTSVYADNYLRDLAKYANFVFIEDDYVDDVYTQEEVLTMYNKIWDNADYPEGQKKILEKFIHHDYKAAEPYILVESFEPDFCYC